MSDINDKKEKLRGLENDIQGIANDSVHLERTGSDINPLVIILGLFQISVGSILIFGVYVWFAVINQLFSALILVVAFWFLYHGTGKLYLVYRTKRLLKRTERAIKRVEITRRELEKEVSEIT